MRVTREVIALQAGRWIVIVDLAIHGPATRADAERVLDVMGEVYSAAGPPPAPVEVHVYPDQASLEEGVRRAAIEAGAAAAAAFEAAAFEALTGLPRLHACAPCLEAVPWGRALLAHETGHTILHASRSYYVVGVPRGVSPLAAYAAAAAVKDLEVNTLLARSGLKWALEGLRAYWRPVLSEANCRLPQWLLDVPRAATAWLAEGLKPPLPPCPGAARVLEALEAAAHKPRPWSAVPEVALAFESVIGGGAPKG